MTAYEAMVTILDINEMLEVLKDNNCEDEPNMMNCKMQNILVKAKDVILAEMESTTLEVFRDDNQRYNL